MTVGRRSPATRTDKGDNLKLKILLGCACVVAAITASAGSATAAAPDGPFTMGSNALPGNSSVKIELPNVVGGNKVQMNCKQSTILGSHDADAVGKLPWTVEHVYLNSCAVTPYVGEVAVTFPKMPKMTVVKSATGAARVNFFEFQPVIKFSTCEVRLTGNISGEGSANPTTSESFTPTTAKLTVISALPSCETYFKYGQTGLMTVNMGSTPIGF
jgi:hypothetical protein